MKKIIYSVLLAISLILLIGCDTQDKEDIDLTTLQYYEYLSKDNPVITIKVKNFGTMKAQLFPEVAENTVNNFISYIEDKAYDKSSFHRIIETFMIQGGAVDQTKGAIKGEFASNGYVNPLKHTPGVLSMARTMIKNSATSQFFIMTSTSPHLDGEYASFGGLISGFSVLDAIAKTPTGNGDFPIESVEIESIRISLNGYQPKDVVYVK